MQPMVATGKERAREEFARLFNEELTRIGAPAERGRIAWVYKKLKEKGKKLVTEQQVRKYVRGIDIPDQAHLRLICERLKLDWVKLAGPSKSEQKDPLQAELEALWMALTNDAERLQVIQFMRFVLGGSKPTLPPPQPPRPTATQLPSK